MPDQAIAGLLKQDRSAEETCKTLVEAANAAGGPDNVTVVVAHFRDAEPAGKQARREAVKATAAAPSREKAVVASV